MSQIAPSITVRYSCPSCGLVDVEVQVIARADEDVLTWMHQRLEPALGQDHAHRSPHCHPERLAAVKIPMIGTERVGAPPTQ